MNDQLKEPGSIDLVQTLMTCQRDLLSSLNDVTKTMEQRLATVGDDAQLVNIDLQNMLQKQQQVLQLMSNVSKMLHDTAMAVVRKIG